jgi:ZIP family zinc transporter
MSFFLEEPLDRRCCMPLGTIILLGAFAGFTIYFGLPFAFLRRASPSLQAFLSMLATGVLIFLLYDVISKASEPIGAALEEVRSHHASSGPFLLDAVLLLCGLGLGSVGLVYFNKYIIGWLQSRQQVPTTHVSDTIPSFQPVPAGAQVQDVAAAEAGFDIQQSASQPNTIPAIHTPGELSPHMLAFLIATGIGLHNFSEGLAIGQSATSGAIQLAIVLIVGFGLHNMTEGFGIAGPLTGQSVSWKFVLLLGLIGGGPTFVGTVVGVLFNSPQVFILCLALAAGAIIYVLAELLGMAKRFKAPELTMWGLLIGFFLGYLTDLIVTFAGA